MLLFFLCRYFFSRRIHELCIEKVIEGCVRATIYAAPAMLKSAKQLVKKCNKKCKQLVKKCKTSRNEAEEAARAAAAATAEMETAAIDVARAAAAEAMEQLRALRQELAGAQEELREVRQALEHALASAGCWNFNFGSIVSSVTSAVAAAAVCTLKIKVALVLGPAVVVVGGGVYLLTPSSTPPKNDHEEFVL